MNLNRMLKQPPRSLDRVDENRSGKSDMLGLPRRAAVELQAQPAEQILTVGRGIEIKGEIGTCETLLVEGHVHAVLSAGTLEVRDGGLFEGSAVVETARVAGTVDGDLTVRGLLTIPAGGRVAGKIRYGELAIEPGGKIAGDIDVAAEALSLPSDEEAVA